MLRVRIAVTAFCLPLLAAGTLLADAMTPAIKAAVDAKVAQLRPWSVDPVIVAAVKAHNTAPPAEARTMTNDKWKTLSQLDPFVRSLSKNALAEHLKSSRDPSMVEIFVSGADGAKVGYLSKTTWWSHRDKDKHRLPMAGKTWIGPLEMDESSGAVSVQVALPVLDGGKPIGSIVIGLGVSKLR